MYLYTHVCQTFCKSHIRYPTYLTNMSLVVYTFSINLTVLSYPVSYKATSSYKLFVGKLHQVGKCHECGYECAVLVHLISHRSRPLFPKY